MVRRTGPSTRSNGRSASRRPSPARSPPAPPPRRPGEVDQRQARRLPGEHLLHRAAAADAEDRAQALVPADQRADAAGERRRRRGSRAAGAPRGRCRRSSPAPSGRGTRAAPGRGTGAPLRHAHPRPGAGSAVPRRRRPPVAPLLSIRAAASARVGASNRARSGIVTPSDLAHPRGDPGGQQRMAAELEEVVPAPGLGHPQDVAPDAGQHLLGRRRRRLEPGRRRRAARPHPAPAAHPGRACR